MEKLLPPLDSQQISAVFCWSRLEVAPLRLHLHRREPTCSGHPWHRPVARGLDVGLDLDYTEWARFGPFTGKLPRW